MKKSAKHNPREAIGCFVMLMFAAFMTLGSIVIIVPKIIMTLLGKEVIGLWRSVLVWIFAPLIGIALSALLTYGRQKLSRPPRRGE